jgi:hypothetical protein
MELWAYVPPAVLLAITLWLVCKAIFQSWFRAKEEYVDRIVNKMKGAKNGKDG